MLDKMTIYAEWIAGRWEARYWASDESRYHRFTSWDRREAVAKAAKHSGYSVDDCKIVFVE